MRKILLGSIVPLVLMSACSSTEPAATVPTKPVLPAHTVSETALSPSSKRIEITSTDPNLSREDCKALINNYLDKAGSKGQVSVRKPSTVPAFDGESLPFCVNNVDSKGTTFNDVFFKQ